MPRFIASSPEETFRSLMIYFNGRRLKISACTRPTYIRAEIGSWFSFPDEGNAKGEMEVIVTEGNSGSYVHVDFDFTKEYTFGFVAAVLGVFLICAIGLTLPLVIIGMSLPKPFEPVSIASVLLIGLSLGVMAIATVMALEERAVFRTKKRLMEEFNMLMQLLSTK